MRPPEIGNSTEEERRQYIKNTSDASQIVTCVDYVPYSTEKIRKFLCRLHQRQKGLSGCIERLQMSWEMEIYGKRIYLYHDKPGLKDMVKIGYATDVESRRKQLSTTALPYEYEIYATYETSGKLEDKKLHKMIDNLNPDLRISKNREFFILSPEDAYELLESIATISGTKDKLKKVKTVPA